MTKLELKKEIDIVAQDMHWPVLDLLKGMQADAASHQDEDKLDMLADIKFDYILKGNAS